MPALPCAPDGVRPDAAELNRRIRQLCAGRLAWSPEALAELARLRAEWQAAVTREAALAA